MDPCTQTAGAVVSKKRAIEDDVFFPAHESSDERTERRVRVEFVEEGICVDVVEELEVAFDWSST